MGESISYIAVCLDFATSSFLWRNLVLTVMDCLTMCEATKEECDGDEG